MSNFNKSGLRDIVEKKVLEEKTPILGICAGMQILTNFSEEGIEKGLGWIDGIECLFDKNKIKFNTKLPLMGWNSINPVEGGLVLFPSYLDHSVNPNLSNKERVVISFNISLIKNTN